MMERPSVLGYPDGVQAAATAKQMTYAEYCELERGARVKHEYLRGQVFAMTGGSLEHARLAGQLIFILKRELAGRGCHVFTSDARVRIEATDLDTYPDVSVVCSEPRTSPEDGHALTNPLLLVEVLSNSTEAYDRGQKAAHYRQLPSLRAYLLVSQNEPRLELMVRKGDGSWSFFEAGAGQELVVPPLDMTLLVDELYQAALSS